MRVVSDPRFTGIECACGTVAGAADHDRIGPIRGEIDPWQVGCHVHIARFGDEDRERRLWLQCVRAGAQPVQRVLAIYIDRGRSGTAANDRRTGRRQVAMQSSEDGVWRTGLERSDVCRQSERPRTPPLVRRRPCAGRIYGWAARQQCHRRRRSAVIGQRPKLRIGIIEAA